ncbi:M24 family metallopeptidase [Pectinatus cerevisiiphilus]|uniref:Xaa-Pro aminopeptidase n=1 Tax=Pectinatus cerevisiiphilus TaxID=86956 RepID=A0A4R3K9M6_9FIRM|nr:Xaa-Pro peptidase family protein [Pectinatus cerevisiiphilus]TCS79690.1 Xaa-Pro aminopeptidase [Pectinatus cerevisiiphilus]
MENNRLFRLRQLLAQKHADAIVINKNENVHYFSGFYGDDSALVITPDKEYLITDSRYLEQAAQQSKFPLVEQKKGLLTKISELIEAEKAKNLAFETNALMYASYAALRQMLPNVNFSVPLNLDGLRIQKEKAEIELIKKAVAISDKAFEHILAYIKPGLSEIDVAAELEHTMRKLGSERPAFTTIVASGKRGSLPHGTATEKLIVDGEFVTMDFGAVYKGYHSDITRTVCVGKASEKQKELYAIVAKAQLLGIASIKPNTDGKTIDAPSRKFIKDMGYGNNYGHGLGHGVGLEIHELPRLSPMAQDIIIKQHMLVTVEPGIYVPDFGGVRIEDTTLVDENGATPLTKSRKELIEL